MCSLSLIRTFVAALILTLSCSLARSRSTSARSRSTSILVGRNEALHVLVASSAPTASITCTVRIIAFTATLLATKSVLLILR